MRSSTLRKLIFGQLLLLVACMIALFPLRITFAQGNLLNDPSFEVKGDYKRVKEGDDVTFDVPQAWNGWVTQTPRTETWMNFVPTGFPHTALFKRDQAQSLHIARGGATFTTAVFQTVAVPEDANVTGSAWGFMERKSGSTGAQFRVGIDPTGGSNPLSGGIIWSPWVTTPDGWMQATVNATAQGTSVTFFLYSTQTQPSDPNGIYWDETSLTVGGPGGTAQPGQNPAGPTATPVIPTPAFVPFVGAQPPQEDGSIVHVVQSGDTLDSIAVAYGKTRQEILDLNSLGGGRFIQIGQRILIQPAPGSEDDEDETETPEGTTEAAETTEGTAESTIEPAATEESTSDVATADVDASAAEPTVEPTLTPTLAPPTSTDAPPAPVTEVAQVMSPPAVSNVTQLCVWMFEDLNQNRIQETTENLLAGGTIIISASYGVEQSYTTDGSSEPFCFEDIAIGDYIAAATAPDGYGLTTSPQLSLKIQASTTTNARFGAAQGVEVALAPPDEPAVTEGQAVVEVQSEPDTTAQLLQLSGLIVFALAGLVMIGGIGAALVLRRR